MKRAQLEHAIRASTTILKVDRVYVIGSQSILGSYGEESLPERATDSVEVDIYPLGDDDAGHLSALLASIGELSEFHANHGFYVDGVGPNTAVLPRGWQDRVVTVPARQLDGVEVVGLCLDPHDLCVSKLVASRTKDLEFVQELVRASLIDPGVLLDRLVDVVPPVNVIIIDGEEEQGERDINHAWAFAQTLDDEAKRLELSIPSAPKSGLVRAGTLGATSHRGRFASKTLTPPEAGL